ncbi:MAG TPA: hypothetical protein VMD77_02180 [Candidatus Baltobacteraceae bacterium]|nr:rhodanese-like domain-containing protein [Verrucomicrobiae bacterium]HTX14074.1 hypothetical protein [Candidatus Baltobacteraceae bacterium]
MLLLRKSSKAFQNRFSFRNEILLSFGSGRRSLAPSRPFSPRTGFGYLSVFLFALLVSVLAISLASILALARFRAPVSQSSRAQTAGDPWTPAQTVQPQELVKELAGAHRPVVVCVGFHPLFDGAHVPGAVFHGSASTSEGLDDLKRWAQSLPRGVNLVAYCGCCPMAHCPNIRPAFVALRSMGFTRLRVLVLPDDFATDWVDRGYPIEKGK